MSEIKAGLMVVVGLVLAVGGFSSCEIIDAGHRGVVIHMGQVQPGVLGEGVHFVAPFVTSIEEMSVRIHKDDVTASAASKDLQAVTSHLAVNWHLNQDTVNKIYQEIGTRDDLVQDILGPAVNEVFKASAARYSAEEILTKRAELKAAVDHGLRERLGKYGVEMNDLPIVDIKFSKEFTEAIEAKQVAEQESQKAKYTADKAKQDADAEVNRARGKAEAQRMLHVSLSPAILQQQAIEKWDGHFPQVMGSGTLPFVNIPLKAQAAQ